MSCAFTPVLLPLALSFSETCYLAERISAWESLTENCVDLFNSAKKDKEELIKILQAV